MSTVPAVGLTPTSSMPSLEVVSGEDKENNPCPALHAFIERVIPELFTQALTQLAYKPDGNVLKKNIPTIIQSIHQTASSHFSCLSKKTFEGYLDFWKEQLQAKEIDISECAQAHAKMDALKQHLRVIDPTQEDPRLYDICLGILTRLDVMDVKNKYPQDRDAWLLRINSSANSNFNGLFTVNHGKDSIAIVSPVRLDFQSLLSQYGTKYISPTGIRMVVWEEDCASEEDEELPKTPPISYEKEGEDTQPAFKKSRVDETE
jgi:hypothetical protein